MSCSSSGVKKTTPTPTLKTKAKLRFGNTLSKIKKKLKKKRLAAKSSIVSSDAASASTSTPVTTKKKRSRRPKLMPTESVPKEFEDPGLEDNINSSASKLGLNRTQVKSVLRQVLESPDLMTVIMEKAGEAKPEGAPSGQFTGRC